MIGRFIAQGLEWDKILATIIATALEREDPLICEVGSNIGASVLQILAAKPRARIIAFEPSRRFRQILGRNLTLAGYAGVEIVPLALGSKPGEMWLHTNASSASLTTRDYDGHESRGDQLVEVTTLDNVVADRGKVDFVKVDTDGFDLEVLRGAERTLRAHKPVLFFEHAPHLTAAPTNDLEWLMSLGYRMMFCFTSSPWSASLGVTDSAQQVTAWANATAHLYSDVLSVHFSQNERQARLRDALANGLKT